jgi:hypothetical protein
MITTITNSNNNPLGEINTKLYENQKYQIDIIFDNLQGNRFRLNLASLVSLEIEEDSRDWYKKAALTIKVPDNVLEIKATDKDDRYYKFRNDGRDIIYITVKPINDDVINAPAESIDYDVWGMNYKFVIYDRKELLKGETTKQKQLTLYLWEFDYQVFAETNLDWSTNEILPEVYPSKKNIVPAQLTDEEKLVPTGLALKSLIKTALNKFEDPKFSKDWDIGSSKIFYNSFANNSVVVDINYLLKKHVSSQKGAESGADPAILSRTRYNTNWQLRSFSTLFAYAVEQKALSNTSLGMTVPSAGPLQREVLTIIKQGGGPDENSLFSLPVTPFPSTKNKNTNYQDPTRSKIKNFQIVDMASLDSMHELVTSPCYSNNFKDKIFELDFQNNEIGNIKKYVQQNYSDKLRLMSNTDTLITLNKPKLEAKSIKNTYSFGPDKISRFAESRNLILFSALFYNTSISFTAPGSSQRQANTFISVEGSKSSIRNEFQNKLLGQWFVYNVTHRFTETNYSNTINAVRLHANDSMNIKDNIT